MHDLIGVILLAQDDDPRGWGGLIYLLIVVVFPLLSKLGDKIRDWSGNKKTADGDEAEGEKSSTAKTTAQPLPSGVVSMAKPRPQSVDSPPVPPVKVSPREPRPRRVKPIRPPQEAAPAHTVSRPEIPRAKPVRPPSSRPPVAPQAKVAPKPMAPRATPTSRERTRRLRAAGEIASAAERRTAERRSGERQTIDHDRSRSLLPRKLNKTALRQAIVLSEILGPPLALRESDGGHAEG